METSIEASSELKAGLKAETSETVNEKNTARFLGSGGLDVYATPAMIALMEKACARSVAPFLPAGASTVGTYLDVKHIAASPLGAKIKAEGTLSGIDGRKLFFTVRAWDDAGMIGEGSHERFIIDDKKFMKKTEEKLGI
ncbi:MAG: thioesterase family protein [Spirochaetaceae bacterium]|jgi:predicted thioesterase|nr:thioesterase family protein [Spirochaetaceae bacterium]